MGNKRTKDKKENMENMSTMSLLNLKPSKVRDLKPEVRHVYDQRMSMNLLSTQEIKGYSDEEVQNFPQLYLSDMKPEVHAVFDKRVTEIEHRQQLQELLKTMVPVQDEEDVKHDQEEEEKKTKEKKFYEVNHVYRTYEKRPSQ